MYAYFNFLFLRLDNPYYPKNKLTKKPILIISISLKCVNIYTYINNFKLIPIYIHAYTHTCMHNKLINILINNSKKNEYGISGYAVICAY